jgi:ketopantoate reductase
MKICICGGGNLGHVVAGFIAAQKKHEVCLLTRHPEQWSQDLIIEAPAETTYSGHLNGLFSNA